VTHHLLQLRRGSALVLICGDVLRDPDDVHHRGVRSPDASFGCRKATGGREGGRQEQGGQRGQGGQEQDPPARPERPRGGRHVVSLTASSERHRCARAAPGVHRSATLVELKTHSPSLDLENPPVAGNHREITIQKPGINASVIRLTS